MRKLLALAVPIVLGLYQQTAKADLFLQGSGLNTAGNGSGTAVASFNTGDKVFSNFTCSIVIDQVANPGECGSIKVSSDTDAFGNLGILFQTFANAISTAEFGAGAVDILIGYTVTAPSPLITDIHMIFNGNATGTGATDVTETVTAGAAGTVGQISVTNPPKTLEAAADLIGGPYTSVSVRKDMLLTSGPSGTASFSFVGQYFSQVPEPVSVVLFGTLLALTGGALRKRARS